jgi:hypothetical protein
VVVVVGGLLVVVVPAVVGVVECLVGVGAPVLVVGSCVEVVVVDSSGLCAPKAVVLVTSVEAASRGPVATRSSFCSRSRGQPRAAATTVPARTTAATFRLGTRAQLTSPFPSLKMARIIPTNETANNTSQGFTVEHS